MLFYKGRDLLGDLLLYLTYPPFKNCVSEEIKAV